MASSRCPRSRSQSRLSRRVSAWAPCLASRADAPAARAAPSARSARCFQRAALFRASPKEAPPPAAPPPPASRGAPLPGRPPGGGVGGLRCFPARGAAAPGAPAAAALRVVRGSQVLPGEASPPARGLLPDLPFLLPFLPARPVAEPLLRVPAAAAAAAGLLAVGFRLESGPRCLGRRPRLKGPEVRCRGRPGAPSPQVAGAGEAGRPRSPRRDGVEEEIPQVGL